MAEKNIELSKLKQGNKILLETKECVFDIELVSPDSGEIIIIGGKRFIAPTKAILVGVYGRKTIDDEDKLLYERQIEKNLGIEIHYFDKDKISCDFVTSPILSAKVYTKEWEFEMWEDNDKSAKLDSALKEARERLRLKTTPKSGEDDENTLS